MPTARLVSKLHSSAATFNGSMSTTMGGRGEERRRGDVRGAERQGEEVREGGRQRDTANVFDADELAYKIILCAKPAGNNSSCIWLIFHPRFRLSLFIPLKTNEWLCVDICLFSFYLCVCVCLWFSLPHETSEFVDSNKKKSIAAKTQPRFWLTKVLSLSDYSDFEILWYPESCSLKSLVFKW